MANAACHKEIERVLRERRQSPVLVYEQVVMHVRAPSLRRYPSPLLLWMVYALLIGATAVAGFVVSLDHAPGPAWYTVGTGIGLTTAVTAALELRSVTRRTAERFASVVSDASEGGRT